MKVLELEKLIPQSELHCIKRIAGFGYIDLKGLIAWQRINLDLHFEGITKGDIYKARNAVAA